jgi:uncharacterized protein YktA (UPF0223 family)
MATLADVRVRQKKQKTKEICQSKTIQKEIATQFRIKSSFSAFKPSDNSVLGKDKGYREKETPAPQ